MDTALHQGTREVVMAAPETTVKPGADFADVFAAHHPEALRLAHLLCGDRHRAEDAVADAFVKVWRQWERGRVTSPRAYIRRAVVNEVNSRFRRLRLERREQSRRTGDGRGERGHEEQVADAAELVAALQRLPKRQRTAIVLRFYGDLSEAVTADVMGCNIGTVKSTVSRGLDRLRELLADDQQAAVDATGDAT